MQIPLFQLGGIFITELQGFHEQFRDCFARSEPRENFFRYLVGQLSDLERKSIEPMSLQVEDGNARAMQRLISDVIWDETAMLRKYHELVAEDSGGPNGVMIFDETSFLKKVRIQSELPDNIAVLWARWKIARWESLPPMLPPKGQSPGEGSDQGRNFC